MSKARLVLVFLVAITLLGSLLKNVSGMVGIPNLTPVLRDPLLLGFAAYGVGKLDFYQSKVWPLWLAATLGFVVPYIFIAMMEDRATVGLYYVRLYLLPFLYFVGAWGVLQHTERSDSPRAMLRLFLYWNNLLFLAAAVLYALLQTIPSLRTQLFGPDLLPSAWYISGGTWMRMGLPLSGPNTLGLVFALNAYVALSLLITQKSLLQQLQISTGKLLFTATLAIAGLLLTFSRSSMLLLVVAMPLLLLLPGVMTFSRLLKIVGAAWVMLALLVVLLLAIDEVSNGFVTRWLVLNTKFNDPSMVGHVRSITDAFDKLYEYVLWGYPKGTVGPKSILFTGITNNVENSFLAVVYDMGLPCALIYGVAVASLFAICYRHRLQAILLVGFFPPCFLLPYVFEADALIYFAYVYLLLAVLLARPSPAEAQPQTSAAQPYASLQGSAAA